MKERIDQIMKKEALTSTRFAEEIGIQRAAVSHILTGRNNPSLDVVTKILHRFPRVSSDWLLFGKGEMYKDTKNTPEVPHLFKNTPLFPDEDTDVTKYEQEIKPNPPVHIPEMPKIEQVKIIEAPVKTVTKIMLFYSDNTFDTFIPEKEPEQKK